MAREKFPNDRLGVIVVCSHPAMGGRVRAADPSSRAQFRCRYHRIRLPGVVRVHGPMSRARQVAHQTGWYPFTYSRKG